MYLGTGVPSVFAVVNIPIYLGVQEHEKLPSDLGQIMGRVIGIWRTYDPSLCGQTGDQDRQAGSVPRDRIQLDGGQQNGRNTRWLGGFTLAEAACPLYHSIGRGSFHVCDGHLSNK